MNKGKIFLIAVLLTYLLLLSNGCSTNNRNQNVDETTKQPKTEFVPDSQQIRFDRVGEKTYTKDNANNLTIEDIKEKYKDRTIINIINYKNYVLVESRYNIPGNPQKTYASHFDLYNLSTGDMDLLPTSDNYVQLVKIINEDNLLFLANGKNHSTPHHLFPFYIECYRGEENVNSQYDFRNRYIPRYLSVDQEEDFGFKGDEVISDIKVTITGLEILFKPAKGKEDEFHAGFTTIPLTATRYIKDNNQFTIKFNKTIIDENITCNGTKINKGNYYINSIELKEINNSSVVIVNLKDTAKFYTADIKKMIDDDLPFVEFYFSTKENEVF